MSRPVAIRAWGAWTAAGVSVGGAPPALAPGELAPWPEAPRLSTFHRRLRRPHPTSAALAQLAQALWGPLSPAFDGEKTGIVLGTSAGSAAADLDYFSGARERGPAFGSPASFVYTLPSSAPSELSIALGMRGGLWTVAAGAATGLTALALGAREVASGRLGACLCGEGELAGFRGARATAAQPGDFACLFVLAPATGAAGERRLAGLGFGLGESGPPADPSAAPPLWALTAALASAPAAPQRASEWWATDPRGFWARVCLDSP